MPIISEITAISGSYPDIAVNSGKMLFPKEYTFIDRHFLPFGRADLTASASLRPIRSGRPRHHERLKGAW
jgi:hypothetical protein